MEADRGGYAVVGGTSAKRGEWQVTTTTINRREPGPPNERERQRVYRAGSRSLCV